MSTRRSPALPSPSRRTRDLARRPLTDSDGGAEVRRLNEVIRVLMDRVERSTSAQQSAFGAFETTIMLENQVRRRTTELEAALGDNERITRALRESEAKFHALVSQSLVGISLIEDGRIVYTNAKFAEIFGYDEQETQVLQPVNLAALHDRPLVAENIRKRSAGEVDHVSYVFRGVRKDGAEIDVDCHGNAMHIGGRMLLCSLIMDVTERTRVEQEVAVLQERLQEQATRDALTGLHNRRYLEESFGRELRRAERAGLPVSVVLGDLDWFKAVNDQRGHVAGDHVLRAFGTLIASHVRESDIACRFGGEEFLLVFPGMSARTVMDRTEQLRERMAGMTFGAGADSFTVTASFGVAVYPRSGRSVDTLVAAADSALYAAKAAGRNQVSLHPAT